MQENIRAAGVHRGCWWRDYNISRPAPIASGEGAGWTVDLAQETNHCCRNFGSPTSILPATLAPVLRPHRILDSLLHLCPNDVSQVGPT